MNIAWDIETLDIIPEMCPKCQTVGQTRKGSDEKLTCLECGHKGQRWDFSNPNWKDYYPLRVSVAAAAYMLPYPIDGKENGQVMFWEGEPREEMTLDTANKMMNSLMEWQSKGHNIVAWNGLNFDFRVMAALTGNVERETQIAMNSIDPMFYMVCYKGHRLGLDATCQGMNIQGKLHEVTLNDGSIITEMDGSKAPQMWEAGETEAVKAYLADDVLSLARLSNKLQQKQQLIWITKKGKHSRVPYPEHFTVEECAVFDEPDTSWMTDPPLREEYYDWFI